MFLVETNVFLEILLAQDKKEDCKKFLDSNIGDVNITDFSLHSIGVILFRHGKDDVFRKFVEDVMPDANLLSLPKELYGELATYGKAMKLNFDDAYQYGVAKCHGLKVVTMDNDFKRVTDLDVLFL